MIRFKFGLEVIVCFVGSLTAFMFLDIRILLILLIFQTCSLVYYVLKYPFLDNHLINRSVAWFLLFLIAALSYVPLLSALFALRNQLVILVAIGLPIVFAFTHIVFISLPMITNIQKHKSHD